jgi:hypothetical protein
MIYGMANLKVIKVEVQDRGFTEDECENIVAMIKAQLPNRQLDISVA